MSRALYVGVDIGGTKIAAGLVDERGELLARDKCSTPAEASPKRILKVVEGLVKSVVSERGRKLKDLRAIGIGAPGIVDPGGKKIVAAPNIDLAGYPVVRKLKERLGRPVILGNDVNLGVLGEQWRGAGKGVEEVVGLFPGTGVGGGVIIGGRLLLGAHGAAAELGHVVVDPSGPLCGCGNRGCLEALASRSAVERDIRKAIKSGEKSIILKLLDGKRATIKSKVLKKALMKRDRVVTRALRRAAESLGAACVNLRHVFDPDLFILGGGLIEACGNFMVPIVQRSLDKDPFFRKVARCRAVEALLGDDAVILGAVALARSRR